jgi:hypothetical protein
VNDCTNILPLSSDAAMTLSYNIGITVTSSTHVYLLFLIQSGLCGQVHFVAQQTGASVQSVLNEYDSEHIARAAGELT